MIGCENKELRLISVEDGTTVCTAAEHINRYGFCVPRAVLVLQCAGGWLAEKRRLWDIFLHRLWLVLIAQSDFPLGVLVVYLVSPFVEKYRDNSLPPCGK